MSGAGKAGLTFLVVVALIAGASGLYLRWLMDTPQYSLALLVLEAHKRDGAGVDRFIDSDSVIDNFVPQIRDAAVEMYGRGIPASAIEKLEEMAEPLKPRIKETARVEVRRLVREKTLPFRGYPAFALATGISIYGTMTVDGAKATLKAVTPEGHTVEIILQRAESRWRIVEVRDPELARRIAETVGQEVLVAATQGGLERVARTLNLTDVDALIEKLDGIFR